MRVNVLGWCLLLTGALLGAGASSRLAAAEIKEVVKEGYIPDLFGVRRVKYIQRGDLALIEGDIRVRPAAKPPISPAVALRRTLWPRGIVPYAFAAGFLNPAAARGGMAQWEASTPIRFMPRTTQPDYIVFDNDPVSTAGSSPVGRLGGAQTITLGTAANGGLAVHEIGHSVGLFHEHTPRSAICTW